MKDLIESYIGFETLLYIILLSTLGGLTYVDDKNIDGPKDFVFRVLSGVAIGIVAGLVPNAILGEILNTLCNIILFSKLY